VCDSQKKDQHDHGLGRSCGGFTTKIHAVCDALGNPLDFIVTAGEQADCTQAVDLIAHFQADFVLADKGYDADYIVQAIESIGAVAVIPSKSNRKIIRNFDKNLYKERHKIECLFGFLKHYRRLFSRFDRYKTNFTAFLHFVAALQWLK
jgi:transposase